MPWPPTAPNAWSCSTGLAIHADPVWARQVGRAIADFVRVPFEDQLSSARKSLPAGPGPRPVLSRSLFFPIPGCALLTFEAKDGFGWFSGDPYWFASRTVIEFAFVSTPDLRTPWLLNTRIS